MCVGARGSCGSRDARWRTPLPGLVQNRHGRRRSGGGAALRRTLWARSYTPRSTRARTCGLPAAAAALRRSTSREWVGAVP